MEALKCSLNHHTPLVKANAWSTVTSVTDMSHIPSSCCEQCLTVLTLLADGSAVTADDTTQDEMGWPGYLFGVGLISNCFLKLPHAVQAPGYTHAMLLTPWQLLLHRLAHLQQKYQGCVKDCVDICDRNFLPT